MESTVNNKHAGNYFLFFCSAIIFLLALPRFSCAGLVDSTIHDSQSNNTEFGGGGSPHDTPDNTCLTSQCSSLSFPFDFPKKPHGAAGHQDWLLEETRLKPIFSFDQIIGFRWQKSNAGEGFWTKVFSWFQAAWQERIVRPTQLPLFNQMDGQDSRSEYQLIINQLPRRQQHSPPGLNGRENKADNSASSALAGKKTSATGASNIRRGDEKPSGNQYEHIHINTGRICPACDNKPCQCQRCRALTRYRSPRPFNVVSQLFYREMTGCPMVQRGIETDILHGRLRAQTDVRLVVSIMADIRSHLMTSERLVGTISDGGIVRIWTGVNNAWLPVVLSPLQGNCIAMIALPTEQLVTWSLDRTIRLWTRMQRSTLLELSRRNGEPGQLIVDQGGLSFFSGGAYQPQGIAEEYDTWSYVVLASGNNINGHIERLDSNRFISWSGTDGVSIWEKVGNVWQADNLDINGTIIDVQITSKGELVVLVQHPAKYQVQFFHEENAMWNSISFFSDVDIEEIAATNDHLILLNRVSPMDGSTSGVQAWSSHTSFWGFLDGLESNARIKALSDGRLVSWSATTGLMTWKVQTDGEWIGVAINDPNNNSDWRDVNLMLELRDGRFVTVNSEVGSFQSCILIWHKNIHGWSSAKIGCSLWGILHVSEMTPGNLLAFYADGSFQLWDIFRF